MTCVPRHGIPDVAAAERLLRAQLPGMTASPEYQQGVITEMVTRLAEYRRQYVPRRGPEGQRVLWINLFRSGRFPDRTEGIVVVRGGGRTTSTSKWTSTPVRAVRCGSTRRADAGHILPRTPFAANLCSTKGADMTTNEPKDVLTPRRNRLAGLIALAGATAACPAPPPQAPVPPPGAARAPAEESAPAAPVEPGAAEPGGCRLVDGILVCDMIEIAGPCDAPPSDEDLEERGRPADWVDQTAGRPGHFQWDGMSVTAAWADCPQRRATAFVLHVLAAVRLDAEACRTDAPAVRGLVAFGLRIDGDGRSHVTIERNDLGDGGAATSECLAAALSRVDLSENPPEAGDVVVLVTFDLSPTVR